MPEASEKAVDAVVSAPAPTPPSPDGELPEPGVIADCERCLGHQFRDRSLLEQALTHASIARTRLDSNERLEFLGDAIMGAVVCEQLYQDYPDYAEGELTRIKSSVVSRSTCARMSERLQLGQFMRLGKGLAVHEQIPSSILAAVFESLIAAIYLDGGWTAARDFVTGVLSDEIKTVARATHGQNYKSLLQQLSQKSFAETPGYRLIDEKGPDHSKCFQVAATIGAKLYPAAWGSSKKEAEQNAARIALQRIEEDGDVPDPAS